MREEGRLDVHISGSPPESDRYSMFLVREDGKWLLAQIKEWPGDDADLADLAWLLGIWKANRTDVAVNTTYEWFGNKSFIRGTISVVQKDRTLTGMQLIGKDPRDGQLRMVCLR